MSAYRVQHFAGAMEGYQHGVMAGMNDNVERLSGRKRMSVAEFARSCCRTERQANHAVTRTAGPLTTHNNARAAEWAL